MRSFAGAARLHPQLRWLGNSAPEFAREPEAGVCRVFCVGDSTTAGWPYQPHGSYPRFMEAALARPGVRRRFEVIDAGLQGFDSARLADLSRELARYKPCAAVLRFGYNDAHHLLYRRAPRSRLRDLHVFLSARSRLYSALRRFSGQDPHALLLLPEVDQLTRAELDVLEAEYERNLSAAVDAFRAGGAAVVVLGLPMSSVPLKPPEMLAEGLLRLHRAAGRVAQAKGAAFQGLSAAAADRLFVDNVHSSLEGNALVGGLAAEAVCAAAGGCAAAPTAPASRTPAGLDGEFLAHADVRVAVLLARQKLEEQAVDLLASAELRSPNGRLVIEELCGYGDRRMLELLSKADARLGRAFAAERAAAAAAGRREACRWHPIADAAPAAARVGLPLPASAAALGLSAGPFMRDADSRAFAAHVDVRLAVEYFVRGKEPQAIEALARAELAAPNRELVLRELAGLGKPRLLSLLARADDRLGRAHSAARAHRAAAEASR